MPPSPKASERNADARNMLAMMCRAKQSRAPQAQLIHEMDDDDDELGMSRDRCIAAAEKLVDLHLAKRVGQTAYSVEPRGVDAHEDDALLDTVLPILRGAPAVPAPQNRSASASVAAALGDAEAAIARGEPASAVDRVHTALHARAHELCEERGVEVRDASLVGAYAALWKAAGVSDEAAKILRSLGAVVEALTTLRNHSSLAHPSALADNADALLAVNAARTITAYIDARFAPDAKQTTE